MRSVNISLVSFLVACSGNSLDGPSGTGGGGGSTATGGDGTSGEATRGGSSYGGGTATTGGSSYGATTSGGSSGEPAQGGSSYGGSTGIPPTTGGGTGGFATGGGAGQGGSPGITSCSGEFPLVGSWVGNVLNYFFEPIEEVRLTLSEAGAGGISGTITWGHGAPPPPAIDAEAAYPPGYEPSWGGFDGAGTAGRPAVPNPWPGFPYAIDRGAACDSTFRFAISSAELWDSWCALQLPVYTEGYGWNCMLVGNGRFYDGGCEYTAANGESATYSPAQCSLSDQCVCDQQSCRYARGQGPTFDLAIDRSGNVEVLTGDDGTGQQTLRLERTE